MCTSLRPHRYLITFFVWGGLNVLSQTPGIFAPRKALEGYCPDGLPNDKSAMTALEFYMGFQMLNFTMCTGCLFLFAFYAGSIVPLAGFVLLWCVYSLGVFFYAIVNASDYGFFTPAMRC